MSSKSSSAFEIRRVFEEAPGLRYPKDGNGKPLDSGRRK